MTPALAVVEELKKRKDIKIFFIGKKYNSDTDHSLTLEYKEITSRGIPFFHLTTGRLTRLFSSRIFFEILKVPMGMLHAWRLVKEIRPDKILSFGGYLALPVALCGFLQNITIYTHEQTISPGIANRIIGLFANKIFLTFPESKKNWNNKKVSVIGNPIRQQIFQHQSIDWLPKDKRKIIYITGGSLGAHSINLHIGEIINQLTKKYTIIHQTGDTKEYDDYTKMNMLRLKLPQVQQRRYIIRKHIGSSEIGSVYWYSKLVVSRAGANTVSEIIALKKPAILIPLPWSAGQEQLKHAQYLRNKKVIEIFDQKEQSLRLLVLIEKVINSLQSYQDNYLEFNSYFYKNAAQTLANSLFT